MTPDQDSWQALVDCPGWALLKQAAAELWGNRAVMGQLRVELAKLNTGGGSLQDWTALARQVAAQDAVAALLAIPGQALQKIERHEEAEPATLVGRRA